MTCTLEISQELESGQQEKAQLAGLSVERYAVQVLQHDSEKAKGAASDEQRRWALALCGKYKKEGSLVDELLKERQEEIRRDEARL